MNGKSVNIWQSYKQERDFSRALSSSFNSIYVKNVINVFFYFGHVFYVFNVFLIFQTFFILKKRWQISERQTD